MDAYIWFRWKGNVNPINRFRFANGVEGWSITKRKIQEELGTAARRKQISVDPGTGPIFPRLQLVRNFPIDEQVLPLTLEKL